MRLQRLGYLLIGIGVVLLFLFTWLFFLNTTILKSRPLNTEFLSHYAAVISGIVGTIFSLVAVLYLIINLRVQNRASATQQVETRFFELLQIHRDNVNEIHSKGNSSRAVFIDIKDEFHELHQSVINNYGMKSSGKNESEWSKDCIQLAYLILFFGVNNSSANYLNKSINSIITNSDARKYFIDTFLNQLIRDHKNQKQENEQSVVKYFLKYDGHQSRLSHYFRHLFQTVTYINNQDSTLLSYKDKYEYIKTLRAQLSTHEQAIFLYNSISPLGAPWELDPKITDTNHKLITKYNLVKNLPEDFTKTINSKTYYPHVYFEFDKSKTQERIELEKQYG